MHGSSRLLVSLCRPLVAVSLGFLAAGAAPVAAPVVAIRDTPGRSAPPSPPDAAAATPARDALEQARLAYRGAGAFRETLELTLTLPDGRQEKRRTDYGVDPEGTAFLALSHDRGEVFRIVARSGRMVAIQLHVDQHYAEVPYDGNFAAALREMGGDQAQLAAPPALVARQGGSPDDFLSAFRLGVLGPLTIAGYHPAPPSPPPESPASPPPPASPAPPAVGDGSPGARIDLQAANGRVAVELDATSHRLRRIDAALGEGPQQVRASGTFRFAAWGAQAAIAWPELTGRTAVRTLAALDETAFPLGQPAPKVALRSLDGELVHPSDLAGIVVVIDFWATWCVPCWTALGHTSELAAWARGSGLPVKVFAVDTLESDPGIEGQRRRAMEFLRAKRIEVPVLLDPGGKAFAAFHDPGLPSLVVLDREGRLARYHSGLLPDMVATVRAEVQGLLATGGKP
jgi:thiol-disulfide isomerase/thioredoxin